MEAYQENLDYARQVRVNAGMGYDSARVSVENDLFPLMDMYVDVFEDNDRRGRRWNDGALLQGDIDYCGIIND